MLHNHNYYSGIDNSNTLNPIEITRIHAVLEDALEKLTFVSSLTPSTLANGDEGATAAAAMVGEEIGRTLLEQRNLEERYGVLIQQRATAKNNANKGRLGEMNAEISKLSMQLRESMKHLCRTLKENPDINQTLATIVEERSAIQSLLEATIMELQTQSSANKVAEYVAGETSAIELLARVSSREESITKEVTKIAALLKEEEEDHIIEMGKKRGDLISLQERVRKSKADNTLALRYARKEGAARIEAYGNRQFQTNNALLTELDECEEQMEIEKYAFERTVNCLQKEQDEINEKISMWKRKLMEESGSCENEIALLRKKRDAELERLRVFQARYEKELADGARIQVRYVMQIECNFHIIYNCSLFIDGSRGEDEKEGRNRGFREISSQSCQYYSGNSEQAMEQCEISNGCGCRSEKSEQKRQEEVIFARYHYFCYLTILTDG